MLKKEQGFTMIELLLVLLMTAIFANIGLSAKKATDRRNLSITAREIQSLIRESQDRAYNEQNIYDVGFYTLTGRCVQITNNRETQIITMPRGITIEPNSFPKGGLRFTRALAPSTGGGAVVLSSKAHQIKMTVLPVTGRVKIFPITKRNGG